MRLLFDVAHPAHVHLFRHLIARVRREGGEALVAARDKDVAIALCRAHDIPHHVLSRAGQGWAGNARELLARTFGLLRLARRFKPDALLGPSASVGPVARMLGRPSFVFCEDDAHVVPLFARIAYPPAHFVVTPACLAHEDYGRKHLTYAGYHELAYLHPNHFQPNPEVCRAIGLDPEQPFFIVRLVALKGHHDAAARGLPIQLARALTQELQQRGRVIITAESDLPADLEPYRFPLPPEMLHDVLAFASLVVADSQTLTAEAAVLGVPNLRCNSFVGRISYLEELENRFGLARGIPVERAPELPSLVLEWLKDIPGLRREMQDRRRRMLDACVDVSDWQWRMLREKLRPS